MSFAGGLLTEGPLPDDAIILDTIEAEPGLIETCTAKGDVTLFTYKHRKMMPEEAMLEIVDAEWEGTWKHQPIKYATYVELQRIVRDAYRTDPNGEFRRQQDAEFYTQAEIDLCMLQLKY